MLQFAIKLRGDSDSYYNATGLKYNPSVTKGIKKKSVLEKKHGLLSILKCYVPTWNTNLLASMLFNVEQKKERVLGL